MMYAPPREIIGMDIEVKTSHWHKTGPTTIQRTKYAPRVIHLFDARALPVATTLPQTLIP